MKIFYGWRMVGAGGGLQFLQAMLLQQAFGAYVAVLAEERGWSKTTLSGAAAMQSAESALLGPVLGWLVDKIGPRAMIRAGVVAFGVGFMLLSRIDSITGFYLAVATIAVGTSLSGYFPINVAVIRWFSRKRARALSAMNLGMAMGGLFVPIVAWSMLTYGWRATAFASGVVSILVGWPLASIFRSRPEDHGQSVDGDAVAPPPAAGTSAAPATPAAPAQREFTAREALRTRAFWLLGLGHGFALLVVTAVNVHAISHMKEGLGYSVAQAALVITLLTGAQIGGVLLGWLIGDRYDKRYLSAGCMLAHGLALLLLTYGHHATAMVAAFAILHGMAWGLRGPLMQAIRADYFGRNAIGMILGLSTLIIAIGQVAGPLVAGVLVDLTGNYRAGFTVLALLAASGSLLFLFARKPV
ncbi:MAG TPA: MFS transporter [Pseudorhodoferax sp.]|jgi:sugar phosphate permease|nr:MFS transporter [Pseudorhodoferax sp.]